MKTTEQTKESIVYYAPHFNGFHIRSGSYTACGMKVGEFWVQLYHKEFVAIDDLCGMCKLNWWCFS